MEGESGGGGEVGDVAAGALPPVLCGGAATLARHTRDLSPLALCAAKQLAMLLRAGLPEQVDASPNPSPNPNPNPSPSPNPNPNPSPSPNPNPNTNPKA